MASYNYIDNTGVIVPDTSQVLVEVQNEYKAAFGSDLVVTPDTPQGVLITAEVLTRMSVLRNNASLANQINPNLAGGIFLDAVWALTGGSRTGASRSTIAGVVLTGNPSVIVPAGTLVSTVSGDVFRSVISVALNPAGTATVDFESVEYGPIPATPDSLTNIVPSTAVLGLDSVTNPNAASLGKLQQSDASVRSERRETLAKQGFGLAEAIMSEVRMAPGVKSLAFRENYTGATVTIDGVELVEHSIWVCVDGGTDLDVATAILAKKPGGCDYNGAVTVDVVEPFSGQTYPVTFDRPTELPILVRATVKTDSSLIDPVTATKQAIMSYVNGDINGETGLQVGTDVSPFELSAAVNIYAPGIFVTLVEVAVDVPSPVYSTSTIVTEIFELATVAEYNIQVIVL
jgi:hypothetical protein